MKRLYFSFLLALLASTSYAQCLTDFTKLLPEPSTDFTSGFGRSIAMHGNLLAVGIPNSDSVGRLTGIVYLFQKVQSNQWEKIAAFAPSTPLEGLQFGWTVTLSEDYLLVGASGYGGKVYLFKKPISGWTSQTEQNIFSMAGTRAFGAGLNNSIAISQDQQTIAITDIYQPIQNATPYKYGLIYVYHKEIGEEWNDSIVPVALESPEGSVTDFGRSGVFIEGTRIITGTPFAPSGYGALYIFKATTNNFQSIVHEATLLSGSSYNLMGRTNIATTSDGIFATAYEMNTSTPGMRVLYFEKPATDIWVNAFATCVIDVDGNYATEEINPMYLSSVDDNLFVSAKNNSKVGTFLKLMPDVDGWCTPRIELIDMAELSSSQMSGTIPNNYGLVNVAGSTNTCAVGYVGDPTNENSQLALKVFSKDQSIDPWRSQVLYNTKKSTAGHRYGRSILSFDDFLFVGAPYDGTLKANGGAVYAYKKNAGTWQKMKTILPPYAGEYDDVFGSALATNGHQLAIGAIGFEPIGKVFIYKKDNEDWSSASLLQEIKLPDNLNVGASGDNLAMNDEWLILPYVSNTSTKITLAIYKFENTIWVFDHLVEVGYGNPFAKTSTISVAIEDDILLAGGNLLQLNQSRKWEVKHVLSPSDPEVPRIKPDFSGWVTNGSLFGHSVSIQENTIFIGAPAKDYQSVWDVGAVYVYTKLPGESWTSRTETAKLLPRVKDEREFFGYSIKNLFNTLIVGAPGGDYYRDERTPRNKPGRSYIFQSKNFFWTDVINLYDFTGDSFNKDYYGLSVSLSDRDFFIGASIEDVENAKLSGSVYVTPTPPLVKLVAPVCITNNPIRLLGYPFGGVWSGVGITNAATGEFDPSVAGVGTHELTYQTSSCAYEGKMVIEVEAPPLASWNSPVTYLVCKKVPFSIALSVAENVGYTYRWYYRPTEDDEFRLLDFQTSSIQAKMVGEYQVEVSNRACSTLSTITKIEPEQLTIEFNFPTNICTNVTAPLVLKADPPGGTWSGYRVSGNQFYGHNLILISALELIYSYTSSNGCVFKDTVIVNLETPPNTILKKEQGNLCDDGFATLALGNLPPQSHSVEWVYKETETEGFRPIDYSASIIEINKNGTYQAKISTEVCTSFSNSLHIDDKFSVEMSPKAPLVKACFDDPVVLSLTHFDDANYRWSLENGEGELILENSTSSLDVKETGYYSAEVVRGSCTFTTKKIEVQIAPKDSVFIPNVFTPNGDGKNDQFKIYTTAPNAELSINNRYGGRVFSGNENSIWKGDEESPGVYFWFVSYLNCHQERKTYKGTIHLIR